MGQDKFYLEKVFPEADKIFSFHYKTVDEIKDNSIYILDTMVLLVPYFTSKESVEDFSKIFKKLKEENKLLIPARVAREFAKNRGQKIAETYNKIIESEERLNKAQITLEKFPIFESNEDYIKLKEIEAEISKLKDQYREKLKELSEDLKNWKWDDPVSKMYQEIFTADTVIEVQLAEAELIKSLEFRFEHFIPPGYKKTDQNKPDSGIGDLIIWQTTLEIGKDKNSDIIFVTNEEQNDWFYRHQGTAISPKYELLDEFRRFTNGKSINIINFSNFLLSQNAQTTTVEEVKILYADTGFKIINKEEFLLHLFESEEIFRQKNGFLGAKFFVETVLADKSYDIGSSWELFKQLEGKEIESYEWKDPKGVYRPLRAVRVKKHTSIETDTPSDKV
ncbi:MAG: PIN domain-containing protein [Phycisphaerales bacterium]|nr:PIN domain-containing protein [Phycisphaerales bacterium]